MSELDFDAFVEHLQVNDIDAAKALVTSTNAQARDKNGYGVLWYMCTNGLLDDHDPLYHFVALGSTLELDSAGKYSSPLYRTAVLGRPRLMRALLDLGTPVDILNKYGRTTLYAALAHNYVDCVWLLLDAGAQLDLVKEREDFKIPAWARDFVSKREKTRKSSVVILGLLHCKSKVTGKNGRDVLRMVARCMWSLRGVNRRKY